MTKSVSDAIINRATHSVVKRNPTRLIGSTMDPRNKPSSKYPAIKRLFDQPRYSRQLNRVNTTLDDLQTAPIMNPEEMLEQMREKEFETIKVARATPYQSR